MSTQELYKYYTNKPYFEYYNANPEGAKKKTLRWDRGDCVIRALAKASGKGWIASYDYLCAKGRRDLCTPSDAGFCRKWWQESGAVWHACKAEKGKKRMTAQGFAESHPKGSYIVSVANHDTAVVDGKIYDVWNCGESAVVGYYDMTNFDITK